MLNTAESQSDTRGTSVPALISQVSRRSWHLAIQSMRLQVPWTKSLKLYKQPQIISVKSSNPYRVLKTFKKHTIVVLICRQLMHGQPSGWIPGRTQCICSFAQNRGAEKWMC